jgi:drug/metabolite transporter (DMT)-like permease
VTGPRRLLAIGAILTVLGIAMAGTAPIAGAGSRAQDQPIAGGVFVVLGWAVFAVGIHRFGRSSQD